MDAELSQMVERFVSDYKAIVRRRFPKTGDGLYAFHQAAFVEAAVDGVFVQVHGYQAFIDSLGDVGWHCPKCGEKARSPYFGNPKCTRCVTEPNLPRTYMVRDGEVLIGNGVNGSPDCYRAVPPPTTVVAS